MCANYIIDSRSPAALFSQEARVPLRYPWLSLRYPLHLHPRIELVPQKVAKDVEAYYRDTDGEAGEDDHPGRGVYIGSVQADHRAPGGGGRLHAEAEERERCFEQDEPAYAQTAGHEDQRERVWQDVPV